MHPSLRVCSARAHRPLISFIGKRVWPSSTGTSHPHPAAPPEFQKAFAAADDAASSTNQGPSSSSAEVFQEFWEAPARFWSPRHRQLEDAEVEAVLVCSLFTGGRVCFADVVSKSGGASLQ
ncbi:hypothetical protein BV22DRAFT_1012464 [Leucogyrophana mollusca]|uniref:Uncharacterized protein n=1 Tax=Leucogyrophana mollusca TaxID=85980 RepID=A0ACB8BJ53_9AGAM|nr:hypothetical protein BV22DRAFT_1012464 [Leucogyrophana mollusca]